MTEKEKKIVVRKEANIEASGRAAGRESNSMPALSKETIDILERLIRVCDDGADGFRVAAADVKNHAWREMFARLSVQRKAFARELADLSERLGEPDMPQAGTMAGDLHRAWLNVRAALTARDEPAVLRECVRGENFAIRSYRDALAQPDLPVELHEMIERQFRDVVESHGLLDAAVRELSADR